MNRSRHPSRAPRAIAAYYLGATVFFVVLDFAGVGSFRVAALPEPGQRLVYYAGLLLCGWVALRRPTLAPIVAMGESVVNLLLLLLSILLPIWGLADALLADPNAPIGEVGIQGPGDLVAAALSGALLVWSFQVNQRRLRSG